MQLGLPAGRGSISLNILQYWGARRPRGTGLKSYGEGWSSSILYTKALLEEQNAQHGQGGRPSRPVSPWRPIGRV